MRHWKKATGVILSLAMLTAMAPISFAQDNKAASNVNVAGESGNENPSAIPEAQVRHQFPKSVCR